MKRIFSFMVVLLMAVIVANAQNRTINGTITSKDDGATLPGVSVFIKGTTNGTVTSIDGTYNIVVPDNQSVLVYSFIGMQTQEITVGNQKNIDVVMQSDVTDIDEVVVTGYGIKKKGTYTGSVEVVSADKIENVPVASFDQVLQGQAAGVVAVGSSGAPGSPAKIRIRGLSSINASNDPLYIMDGIPINSSQFSSLNQNDIESINILKDATAASLYGSRASNGVIVITTKRGKNSGRTEFTYRGQRGINAIAGDNFEMMNTAQKIAYEEEIGLKTYTPEEKLELMKINTDWLDVVLRDASTITHEVSARGGNEKTRFYMSTGYYYQEGIQYRSDFERYTFRVNLDNKLSDKASLGTNFTMGYEKNSHTITSGNNVYNPIFSARLLNPYLRAYNDDGSYNNEGLPWANPIEQLEMNDNDNNTLKIVGGVFLDIELLKGLRFKTNVGVDFYDFTSNAYLSPESEWGASPNGKVSRVFTRNFRITPTNTLTYRFKIRDNHDFSILGGQELILNNYEAFNVSGKNIPNDKLKVLGVTSEIDSWGGNKQDYSVASFFLNTSYNYKYRYLLDLSIRRDGSSRFGANNKWGTFWSAGIGWNIQEESFMSDIHWIDQLKLRASIGETGNYNIGNYQHLGLFDYTTYMNQGGSYLSQLENPDLTWEKKSKMNVALDISVKQRYRMKVDLYNEVTTDMLFSVPLSATAGVGSRISNIGEMGNKGIEFELDADIVKTGDFLFNLNMNVAYNKNEVLKLYGDINEIDEGGSIISVGESYGTFYMVEWAGVNPANGKGLWYTKDGQVSDTFNQNNRKVLSGKSYLPPLSGGFTSTFNYKKLALTAFFSWMKDKWMINNTRYFIESNGMFASYNQSVEMLDYWKEPGDIARNPHPKYSASDNQFDTRLLEDASFLRLKNLTISYDMGDNFFKWLNLFKSARIYVQGQNLFTFTKYTGIDPEYYGTNELNMYPHVKTYTFGIDLGF
ncbi:MAG: TonB-dependent receptor [Bacteroidales bacterium]|nr:TonB-dependent receptor [Bacteroidales bacterium]